MKIPVKPAGSNGTVLHLHEDTCEQNLSTGSLPIPTVCTMFPWHTERWSTQEDWQVMEICFCAASSPELQHADPTTGLKQRPTRFMAIRLWLVSGLLWITDNTGEHRTQAEFLYI